MDDEIRPDRKDYLALTPLFDSTLLDTCNDGDTSGQLLKVFDDVTKLMIQNSGFNKRFPRVLREVARSYQASEAQALEHFSDITHIKFTIADIVEFLNSKKAKAED
ncbi:MAG: hypothetical protein HQL69_15450 [Magnetococcales bacterium]|nr:hypothetical protein [Magnetococcales bacterium]